MKKIVTILSIMCVWVSAYGTLPEIDSQNSTEGMVYVHTSRNAPQFKRNGKAVTIGRGELVPADGLSVECVNGQYVTLIFSNRTAVYMRGKSRLFIEKFEQVSPFRTFLTDEREASRSTLRLGVDSGEMFFTSLTPRPTSRMIIKTPFGTIEPRSRSFVLKADETATVVSIVDGQSVFCAIDGKPDFIQQKQIGIVEKAQSNEMYPLKIEPLTITQEEEYSAELSLCKMALQTVDFKFDDNGKLTATRLVPKEFFIRRGKYDYRK